MHRRRDTTAILTHYGRRSKRPYRVTVWYVVLDGRVWIGSLDASRSWVRNVGVDGRCQIDLGDGPKSFTLRPVESAAERGRFERAVVGKHPVLGRLLRWIVRGERCAFVTVERLTGQDTAAEK